MLQPRLSQWSRVGGAFTLGVLIGSGVMWMLLAVFTMVPTWLVGLPSTNELIANTRVDAGVVPTHLSIPAVGIDTTFGESLGLNQDQTIVVPEQFDTVGWYQYGPLPGERGPAVVLGHVDSKLGPAVFYPLRRLQVGDIIEIVLSDGTVTQFVTERITYTTQTAFPTEAVYGDTNYPGLRLVTCSGTYASDTNRYSHNLIVYARAANVPAGVPPAG
ncbi:MAG TPA: sortase [Candidatus Paceibacterota bacterium]|nr:sortase [Candidatus Paceibacterota bacterium]